MTAVVFVTLLLGLVCGPQDVEVAPGAGTAAVEFRLDGRLIRRLTAPPWRITVDLGAAPEPHDLAAAAFDAEGREIGRTRQHVNLPRAAAEATLALDPGTGGNGRTARLSWKNATGEAPLRFAVTFNGLPLTVMNPDRIELPAFVPERLQFLRAELEFPGNTSAVADIAFGGRRTDEAASELTAAPIVLTSRKVLPPLAELSSWFRIGGKAAAPTAIDEGPADVVLVLDTAARQPLKRFAADAAHYLPLSLQGRLKKDQLISFIWPVAIERENSGARWELFPRSESYTPADGGILRLLTHLALRVAPTGEQRLADAVGVAGLTASARNRARAVVLLVGDDPQDASHMSVADARNYLEKLRVPLVVWSTSKAREAGPWSTTVDISSADRFEAAVKGLVRLLGSQRILWFAGSFLPQSIELTESASGIAMAR